MPYVNSRKHCPVFDRLEANSTLFLTALKMTVIPVMTVFIEVFSNALSSSCPYGPTCISLSLVLYRIKYIHSYKIEVTLQGEPAGES